MLDHLYAWTDSDSPCPFEKESHNGHDYLPQKPQEKHSRRHLRLHRAYADEYRPALIKHSQPAGTNKTGKRSKAGASHQQTTFAAEIGNNQMTNVTA